VPSRRRTRGWRIPSPRTRSRATVSIITRVALAAPSERAQRAEITICVSEVERTARMGRRRSSFHAAVGPIRARGPHVDRRGPAWVPSSRAPHPGNEGPARAGVPRGSGWRLRGAGIRDSRREAPVVAHQASGDRVRQTARTKLSVLRPVWRARPWERRRRGARPRRAPTSVTATDARRGTKCARCIDAQRSRYERRALRRASPPGRARPELGSVGSRFESWQAR
jgi:hypothetical protein